ncbi:MAG: phospholipid carrier-dependent glycosyltransferase [Candidatus Woesearchaeota archaeon]|nr:phospholipid carrier-dependent glycosyltransferase [Candidatus Woesearchaeota archaeon]
MQVGIMKRHKEKNRKKEIGKLDIRFIILISAVVAFVLLFPQLIRYLGGNNTLIGQETYFHIRLVEDILNKNIKNISEKDNLVFEGREIRYMPYHFVIAGISCLFGIHFSIIIFSLFFGVLSAVILYLLLKEIGMENIINKLAVVMFVISPAFVYIFIATPESFSLFFTLLGAYLFLKDKRYFVFSLLSLLLASISSLFNLVIICISLLAYSILKRERQRESICIIIIIGIVSVLLPPTYSSNVVFSSSNLFKEIISDIGGQISFSVFFIILSIVGMVFLWKTRYKYYVAYVILAFFILLFFIFGRYSNIYTALILSFFAAYGVCKIKNLKWQLNMIKNLTFLIIACGFAFSLISYSVRLSQSLPNNEIEGGLKWLKNNSLNDSIVMSHPYNGFFIEYWAERKVLLDSYLPSIANADEKYIDSYSLFHSDSLEDARKIMDKYNIKYIIITEDMRNDLKKDEYSLLYLFRNNETFKNVYNKSEIEIWKYIKAK